MDETVIISVNRVQRRSEVFFRRAMAVLTVIFLLQAVMFSTGFMLPCFLTALCYFWYSFASRREYEYTLEDRILKIDRVSDRGRRRLYEIPFASVQLLCEPDAPEALPYKKGGSVKVKKEDFTSYRENVPYYTLIARDGTETRKFLLDLTPEAIRLIRRWNREAVLVPGI